MNKNKRYINFTHPENPEEFLLLMTENEAVTHWMAADGTWVAFSDNLDIASEMFAGLPGSGLLPKWDEDLDD